VVEVLEEAGQLTAEVALVALQLAEFHLVQEETVDECGLKAALRVFRGGVGPEAALHVRGGALQALVGAEGLVGGDAGLAPEDEGDLLREDLLQPSDRGEALDDALPVGLPLRFAFVVEGDR
jgi:hypothetical protein